MSLVISIIKLLTNIILSILLLIGASTALWVCIMMAFLIVAIIKVLLNHIYDNFRNNRKKEL